MTDEPQSLMFATYYAAFAAMRAALPDLNRRAEPECREAMAPILSGLSERFDVEGVVTFVHTLAIMQLRELEKVPRGPGQSLADLLDEYEQRMLEAEGEARGNSGR